MRSGPKTKAWALGLFASAAMAGCATSSDTPASLTAVVETAPTAQSDANTAVLIPHADAGLIIGTSETAGIEIYDLNGARLGAVAAGAAVGLDARYAGAGEEWTIGVLDGAANRLRLFALDAATGTVQERSAREISVDFAGESLCLYRDARDQSLYAFVLGGAGEIAQYIIFNAEGGLDARLVRRLHLASETSYCTTDDASGDLYVAEQGVGFWRFDADPEAEVVPELIDAVRLGSITEEAGGIAIYDAGSASYLVGSDASGGRLLVYDRNADHALVGSFSIADAGGGAVGEPGALHALAVPLGETFARGALLATDEDNDGGANYKLVSWADIAGALGLSAGTPRDPRVAPESTVAVVRPTAETAPVETDGDSADDPAIWIDRSDPSRSIVIGTQKQSGLYVYDLQGRVLQFLPDGRMNNVDLRENFQLGGRRVALAAASNRTRDTLALYRVDPSARRLVDVADGQQPTGFVDPYGLCMYQSAQTGRTYVFVTNGEGPVRQWELVDAGNGRVRADRVRDIPFGSQTEGCVADDQTGILYVTEEDVGLWRVGAEPDAPASPVSIATVDSNPALHADLEGIGIYDLGDGRGYLVLSSQGDNTFAVFRREAPNAYVGSFSVLADSARGIDGVSETDGLEVTSADLGGAYAAGLLIAQDGRNIAPPENQNFKLVPWSDIAAQLGLESRRD